MLAELISSFEIIAVVEHLTPMHPPDLMRTMAVTEKQTIESALVIAGQKLKIPILKPQQERKGFYEWP